MARNKKAIKKTPKKGRMESRVGPKSKRIFKGSNKSKKFISKQKCRLGFNELSPNPQDVGPCSSTTPTAPSSFGSAENSPMTRRARGVMEKFKNNHMVPNMGLKRPKTATKNDSVTVSMKVNFAKSKISDKKKKILDSLKGQVCKPVINVSDGVKSGDIKETNNVINVSCSSVNESDNKKDEESTILLDDTMDEYNDDNIDSSHIDVIKDPEHETACAQGSTKMLFPATPPPPQWRCQLHAPEPSADTPASLQASSSPASPQASETIGTTPGTPITAVGEVNLRDGDSTEAINDSKNDPVENLGEEMLNFVGGKAFNNPIPDTPKTLVKRGDEFKDNLQTSSNESEKKSDETEDNVIVIDEDDDLIDEDDDIAIVGEVSGNKNVKSTMKPLSTSNLQAITERYQPPSQDFIGFEIDKTPRKPTKVQTTQKRFQQFNQKWKEMRKKVKRCKNIGGPNLNTLPLPRNNLQVGPSLLSDSQRPGPSNPPNKKTPKPLKAGGQRGSQDKRAGDWTCTCGNYNFQWRNKCGKCCQAKNKTDQLKMICSTSDKCNNRGGPNKGEEGRTKSQPRGGPNKGEEGRTKSPPRGGSKKGEAGRTKSPPPVQNEGPTSIAPQSEQTHKSGLRPIVIDGSNVAMAHGLNTNFSAKGIQICIEFFKKRGHAEIKAFMPQIRQGADPELLEKLYKDGHIVFTPSRKLHDGTNVISYDDSMFIEYAHELGGVIVSRDNFKDVMKSKPEWRETIETRLLMPTFAGDYLMFPPDPLGREGPSLDKFLKF